MSIEVTEDLVEHIAKLARLALDREERKRMDEHFRKVLDYVRELDTLDLENVELERPVDSSANILRADVPKDSLPVEAPMRNAPASEPPYFLLPRIVDAGGAS